MRLPLFAWIARLGCDQIAGNRRRLACRCSQWWGVHSFNHGPGKLGGMKDEQRGRCRPAPQSKVRPRPWAGAWEPWPERLDVSWRFSLCDFFCQLVKGPWNCYFMNYIRIFGNSLVKAKIEGSSPSFYSGGDWTRLHWPTDATIKCCSGHRFSLAYLSLRYEYCARNSFIHRF